jgi:tRNA(fMet)-specific endonuclease VapC
MSLLLDTSVISDFVKGEPGTVERLLATPPSKVAVPVLARFEVSYGLELDRRRARRLRDRLDAFFSSVTVLPFEVADADEAARVRAELRRVGRPIGPYDVLIAGMARNRSLVLVSANSREFMRVESLTVENWRASAGAGG